MGVSSVWFLFIEEKTRTSPEGRNVTGHPSVRKGLKALEQHSRKDKSAPNGTRTLRSWVKAIVWAQEFRNEVHLSTNISFPVRCWIAKPKPRVFLLLPLFCAIKKVSALCKHLPPAGRASPAEEEMSSETPSKHNSDSPASHEGKANPSLTYSHISYGKISQVLTARELELSSV